MRKRRTHQIQLTCGHIRTAFSKQGHNYYCVECNTLRDGEVVDDHQTKTTV